MQILLVFLYANSKPLWNAIRGHRSPWESGKGEPQASERLSPRAAGAGGGGTLLLQGSGGGPHQPRWIKARRRRDHQKRDTWTKFKRRTRHSRIRLPLSESWGYRAWNYPGKPLKCCALHRFLLRTPEATHRIKHESWQITVYIFQEHRLRCFCSSDLELPLLSIVVSFPSVFLSVLHF